MIGTPALFGAALLAAAPLPATPEAKEPAALPPAPSESSAVFAVPLGDGELSEQRGGYTITLADQTLVAVLEDNWFDGDYSAGSVMFSNDALSGFTGMGNFVVNTGLQANLIAGMNVTINVDR